MSSTFSALNTASLALYAQQRAIDVTGQNIANVNTDGYSRQRVDMQSIGGSTVPAIWSLSSQVGQGVNADQVTRIRDAFLEARAQTEHATTASLTVQSDALSSIEQSFQEPGTTGIQSMLTNVSTGWSDIHNNPTDPGARSQLLQRTQTLVAGLHTVAASLDGQWTNTRDSLDTLMTDVNSSAKQVADLNQAIERATDAKMPTNELQDKRDVLILHLADTVGATSVKQSDGTLSVSVGGTTLVSGNSPLQLKLAGATSSASATATPPVIVTDPGGTPLSVGGTAQGQLSVLTSIIPRYQGQLDGIAQQLAAQTNAGHAAGYDLNGNPGKPMFGQTPTTAPLITAANITMLITDPSELAAAAVSPTAAGGVTSGDGGNADAMFQLRLTTNGVDATYRKMIVAAGVETATATGNLATQSVVSSNVDSARDSVSGVSTDEEMTNMLQFQHGYQAAGKLVETINSMLDDLMAMVR
ncbi:MAG: flagellar hook-associated protein 1 [Blastococcus sp.]|nr:flagellar hook-associated protein 1 [Blastococcus sp.]